jgi:DNA-binding NarL/FixJ family response regulator
VVINADLAGSLDESLRIMHTFNMRYPDPRIILLIDEPSREMVVDPFRFGASGISPLTQPVEDFLKCVSR